MKVADFLSTWIPCVIQSVATFISSKDIDRGSVWFSEITGQLNNAELGIVCLTKENKNKPWILFESGALAKGLSENRVCTFLIDLVPTDLENPLASFNHTLPTKDGVYALLATINKCIGENALREGVLQKTFDTFWPAFENDFNRIISNTLQPIHTVKRDNNEILLEVLTTMRELDKRIRPLERKDGAYPFDDLQSLHKERLLLIEKIDVVKNNRSGHRNKIMELRVALFEANDEERKSQLRKTIEEKVELLAQAELVLENLEIQLMKLQ